MMLRANALFLLALVVVLVIAFDPAAREQAKSTWEEIKPALIEIKDDLTVFFYKITQNTSHELPEQAPPPVDDSPLFNASLGKLWNSF